MRGSVDGFSSEVFHQKCDKKGPTLTVIKANNRVFGGFTNLEWDSSGSYLKGDPDAFVFRVVSIEDENNSSIEKFNYFKSEVIGCYKDFCAIFGCPDDILLLNNCNQTNNNFSDFGGSFQPPQGIVYGSE